MAKRSTKAGKKAWERKLEPPPVPQHAVAIGRQTLEAFLRTWTNFASGKTSDEIPHAYREALRSFCVVARFELGKPGRTVTLRAPRDVWMSIVMFCGDLVSTGKAGKYVPAPPLPGTELGLALIRHFDVIPPDPVPPPAPVDPRRALAVR